MSSLDDNDKIVICDKCLSDIKIELKCTVFNIRGERYLIRWFNCPYCGRLYIVYVDNSKTDRLKNEIKQLEFVIRVANDAPGADENQRNEILKEYKNKIAELNRYSCGLCNYFEQYLIPCKTGDGEIVLAYHEG